MHARLGGACVVAAAAAAHRRRQALERQLHHLHVFPVPHNEQHRRDRPHGPKGQLRLCPATGQQVPDLLQRITSVADQHSLREPLHQLLYLTGVVLLPVGGLLLQEAPPQAQHCCGGAST